MCSSSFRHGALASTSANEGEVAGTRVTPPPSISTESTARLNSVSGMSAPRGPAGGHQGGEGPVDDRSDLAEGLQ